MGDPIKGAAMLTDNTGADVPVLNHMSNPVVLGGVKVEPFSDGDDPVSVPAWSLENDTAKAWISNGSLDRA